MKKTLLTLATLFVGSIATYADGWTVPVPEIVEEPVIAETISDEATFYYLYNVKAGAFYTEGNDYGTRASYSKEDGLKMYMSKFVDDQEEDPVWDGNTLLFNDYSIKKNGWNKAFIDNENAIYVDLGSQPNYYWQIKEVSKGTFRFYGADINPTYNHSADFADCYMGIDLSEQKTLIFPLLWEDNPNAADYCLDWQFVSEEAMEAYKPAYKLYVAAMKLGELLDEAVGYGIDCTAEKAVFDNTSSSLEAIEEASVSVAGKINDYKTNSASPENPSDVTSNYLTNWTFNDSFSPWQTTTGARNNAIATNQCDGTYSYDGFWENWNSTPFKGKMFTNIENISNGVYNVYMAAFTSGGGYAYVYANGNSTEVTTSNMAPYDVFTFVTDGKMELGLKKDTAIGEWMGIDNVRILYYGNTLESYKMLINKIAEREPAFEGDNVYVQKSALAEYKSVLENTLSQPDVESIVSAYPAFVEALKVMKANYDAYQKYIETINEISLALSMENLNGDEAEELSDVLIFYKKEVLQKGELSTEEILAEAARLMQLLADARVSSLAIGDDATKLLINPDFSNKLEGWEHAKNLGNPVSGGTAENPCVERFEENFDFYQEVAKNVPDGIYQLNAAAFYRTSDNDATLKEYQEGTDVIKTFIYLNDRQKAVKNQMSEPLAENIYESGMYTYTDENGTFYIPNSMSNFSVASSRGMYENQMYGIVTDGKLKVGIRSLDGSVAKRWSIWDNFRLVYWGKKTDKVYIVLGEAVEECLDILAGDPTMSEYARIALETALGIAERSLNEEGNVMFDNYVPLMDAKKAAEANIKAYEQLSVKYEELTSAAETYQNTASPEAIDNAGTVIGEIEDMIANLTATTDEVNEMVEKAEKATSALMVPAQIPTDDEPVDYTNRINNPTFDNADLSGWSGTSWSRGGIVADGAEQYNKKFDTYQEIKGLPKGTYGVSVQAFYRRGSNDNDYALYNSADRRSADNVVLYAVGENGKEQTAAIIAPSSVTLNSEQIMEYGLDGNDVCKSVASDVYVPNSMKAADYMFNEMGLYNNHVYVNVGEDGYLKIGLKFVAEATLDTDWTLCDNWVLTAYSRENSKFDPAVGINDAVVAKVVKSNGIFNLAGQKLSAPIKGSINIINGSKVFVK